jgi:hypothetical protein
MADPLAPTVPARVRGEAATEDVRGPRGQERGRERGQERGQERDHERGRGGDDDDGLATSDLAGAVPSAALPELRRAGPLPDALELAVAEARAAAALFGETAAVRVGRYRLIERVGAGGMGVVWQAWDPELNRGVALKLASAGDDLARTRAREEGKALARLSHPNVVPIYDVLEAPEGVFLVMELVKGKTLRAVAAEGAKTGELVRAYRQCGDGLAAAHRAGLIHRDFKPDNAILGADGRVRVLDFGLAHEVSIDDDGASPAIAGTPKYMAPEQRKGLPLTAAVDQYTLGASLREAASARGSVPRWLEPILARATATRADDRFPSMDALVAALGRDPATVWRRRAVAGGAVIAVGAVAAAFTLGRANQGPSACEGSAETIAASWGGARKAAAAAHLTALAGPYALESVPAIVRELDRYAEGWATIHQTSCQAHARRELSPAAYDRRTACLARRRTALATVGELASRADADGLPGLVIAVNGLPALGTCEDDDALASPVTPPALAQKDEAAAIADLIARVDVERDAGDTTAAIGHADEAVRRARALVYAPLIARALLARGRIDLTLAEKGRGRAQFEEATRLALEVGDEPLAIEAYARAAFALGTAGKPAEAVDGLPLIEAITARLGDAAAFPRALLHHNVGTVELARGDRPRARTYLEQSRRESASLTGAAAIEMTVALQSLMVAEDDDQARHRLADLLVTTRTRLLGPNHPLTLEAALMRGGLIADRERGREQLIGPCATFAELHPWQRGTIRECAFEVAWRSAVAGDPTTTAAMASRVLAAAAPDDVDRRIGAARGYLALATGRPTDAIKVFALIGLAGPTASWWRQIIDVDIILGRALAELAHDDPAEAAAALDRAEQVARGIAGAAPIEVSHRLDAVAAIRARLR